MKKFAIFLPQFHEIPENNRWWGKGFTEWVNVKRAKPLFKGHDQPKVPLNNNYYNLLDSKTVKWQEELLHKYDIDGFIYYHYFFDGKLLLEKPALNLLNDKSINYKFFFCWASEPWRKTWNGTCEIIMPQSYGKEYWEEHFQYLLQFFNDNRYEKKDNKPLFMVHNTEDIRMHSDMIDYFDQRCKEEGFSGIGIVETYRNGDFQLFQSNKLQQTVLTYIREPEVSYDINKRKILQIPKHSFHAIKKRILKEMRINWKLFETILEKMIERYDGNSFYNIMTQNKLDSKTIARGVFFGWDNTPRHSYRGYVISAPDKKHFDTFIESLENCEYLFINAWNEWAEGMVLEPTEKDRYTYLSWLKNVK